MTSAAGVALRPLAWGYGLLTGLRNVGFDLGILAVRRAGAPVVSVGNLVAGGTGKTPFVEYLARLLLDRGRAVAVVSRGYGRCSRGVLVVSDGTGAPLGADLGGDEPVQLARRLPRLCVVVGEDRVAAARHAVDGLGASVIVLDDGFQHRHLHRDCNILMLDARTEIARVPMLPAGSRREPLRGLSRADLVVLSRDDPARPAPETFRRWFSGPVVRSQMVGGGFRRVADDAPVDLTGGSRCLAVSGIADHGGFLDSLRAAGLSVCGERRYSDHHRYRERDLADIAAAFHRSGAEWLITTEKDAERFRTAGGGERFAAELPLIAARIELRIISGEESLVQCVEGIL